jgi:hypothetical protein
MSDDWDKGGYKAAREALEQAQVLAGEDKFRQALIFGLQNLVLQIENDMVELRDSLAALRARGTRQ